MALPGVAWRLAYQSKFAGIRHHRHWHRGLTNPREFLDPGSIEGLKEMSVRLAPYRGSSGLVVALVDALVAASHL